MISCDDFLQVNAYMERLYQDVFKRDFKDSSLRFKGQRVLIRKEPLDGDKEHGFTHMTHEKFDHDDNDPNNRVPDFKRSERLPWVKYIIENYEFCSNSGCERILYWEEIFRGYTRVNLLMKEERFLVVLEKRDFGYLVITSFYLDKDWALDKRIKKYNAYIKQKTP